MKKLTDAPFLRAMQETAGNMYRLGWDERNGGNLSCLLTEDEVRDWLDGAPVLRRMATSVSVPELEGRCLLVTGTGKYFKNMPGDPETNLGVVRLVDGGAEAELLWGFSDGGRCTSEMPAHLLSHAARLREDPAQRIVLHCHPTYTLAMNHVHPLDDRAFSRSLWQTCTESILVFPDGVGVLPCMLCGTREIGEATAEKLAEFRVVIWGLHGVYGTGRSYDEAFGLVETVEKAAQIYMLTAALPHVNHIPDGLLLELAQRYGLRCREDFLNR